MSKYERRQEINEKLHSAVLSLPLKKGVEALSEEEKQRYELVQSTLSDLGVTFRIEEDQLFVLINPDMYASLTRKTAGRKTKFVKLEPDKTDFDPENVCKYSDVLNMLQTMSDREVREKLGMSQATYFRHKKAMLDKEYVRDIDRHLLKDLKALQEALGELDLLF